MSDDLVLVDRRDDVLVVTLNRPDARNAVNGALARGVAAALDRLDAEPELAVGVLTGAGKGFCAGMDLKAFLDGETPIVDGRGFAGIVERPARKPLIAAIEGFAVAGGLEIALACDLVVAGRSARLGVPEVKLGLVAAAGALRALPRRMGYGAAFELALTGELIDAERAHAQGLVDRLADDGGALETALALARRIADNGPLALAATKDLLRRQADWDEATFWREQARIVAPVFDSDDAREGAAAFAERRAPVWRGR